LSDNETPEFTFKKFEPKPAVYRGDVTVDLIDSMGDEKSIVRAARVSTKGAISRGEDADTGLIRRLYKDRHGVPFEAPVFTWYFEAPIVVTRQILKHRLSSINEESGRYKELEGVFYMPREDRKLVQVGKTADYEFVHATPEQAEIFRHMLKSTCDTGWYNYQSSIHQLGICKEASRFLLPAFALYSSMYYTANLRATLNFLSLRKDWGDAAAVRSHPQDEVEQVAEQMAVIVKEKFPTVWEMFLENGCTSV
jgi:thymidylate synthase (FAD)